LDVYKNKKFSKINFIDNIKFHRYYLRASIIENDYIDIAQIITKFKKDTGVELNLKWNEIIDLKSKYSNKYNKMSLLELIKSIKEDYINLDIKNIDIQYKYINNNKNKQEKQEENIIIFWDSENLKLLEDNNINEFFIDTTYKIIPKKFRPYKLLIISFIVQDNSKILCFVLYKFQDIINYERIFSYLKDNYNFYPKIVTKNLYM